MFRGVKGGHVSNVMHLVSCESNTGCFFFLFFFRSSKNRSHSAAIFFCVLVLHMHFFNHL